MRSTHCPLEIHIYLEPQHVTLFGKKTFRDVASQIKVRSYWIRMGPDPDSGVLLRRACEGTQARRPRDHRGGVRSGASVNPGTPRMASNYRKLGEAGKGRPLEALR